MQILIWVHLVWIKEHWNKTFYTGENSPVEPPQHLFTMFTSQSAALCTVDVSLLEQYVPCKRLHCCTTWLCGVTSAVLSVQTFIVVLKTKEMFGIAKIGTEIVVVTKKKVIDDSWNKVVEEVISNQDYFCGVILTLFALEMYNVSTSEVANQTIFKIWTKNSTQHKYKRRGQTNKQSDPGAAECLSVNKPSALLSLMTELYSRLQVCPES